MDTHKSATDTPEPTRLLTERDLARRWQVAVKTLQNARLCGRGPSFVKLGRTVRYQLADIEAFEAAAMRQSTSDAGGRS